MGRGLVVVGLVALVGVTSAFGCGLGGASAGGGGGATGRVFFGTRTPALLVVGGKVSALRFDFPF